MQLFIVVCIDKARQYGKRPTSVATKHHQVQFRAVCHNKTALISDHIIFCLFYKQH